MSVGVNVSLSVSVSVSVNVSEGTHVIHIHPVIKMMALTAPL